MRATKRASRRRDTAPVLQPASLRRRAAASLINAAAGLGGLATTVGAGALVVERLGKLGYDVERITRIVAEPQRIAARLESRPFKLAVRVLTLVTPLRRVKRRSPGYAMLGLRLLDAHSGRAPSRRQKLVRSTATRLWPALCRRMLPIPKISPQDRDRLRAEMDDVRRRFPDDAQARSRALAQIYEAKQINPLRESCLPALAMIPLQAAIELPIFSTPLRQSLIDKLAGTAVVRDQSSDARR